MAYLSISRPARPSASDRRPSLFALIALARSRAKLAALDDAALQDIGISRAMAETEAGRGFWDAPQHWTKQSGKF